MKQLFVRLDRCTGCHTCELACAVEHSRSKDVFSSLFESPLPKKRLYVQQVDGKTFPIFCRHCDDAPCMAACLSGALWRDERGAVRRKKEKCIGCWTCILVCPYGVIGREFRDGKWISVKCDLCDDRESPACVASCPTRALGWAEPEEFAAMRRRSFAEGVTA